MFSFAINKQVEFRNIIENIKEMVDIIEISISENGFSISSLDDCHICLCIVSIHSTFFDEIDIDKEELLSISSKSLSKILKVLDVSDTWYITYNEDLNEFVIKDNIKEYSLLVLDYENTGFHVPDIDFDLNIVKNAKYFHDIIKVLTVYGDENNLRLWYEGDNLVIASDSPQGSERYVVKGDRNIEDQLSSLSMEDIIFDVKYNLTYFQKFTKSTCFDVAALNLSMSQPLCYTLSNTENNFTIKYYLAPLIKDEDY
jgi:proliferating cell nuclear antigen PCNA